MRIHCFLLVLFSFLFTLYGQEDFMPVFKPVSEFVVTGHVFFDKNMNGVFDKDEIGIPEVHVQFYHMIAQVNTLFGITDKLGKYSLPIVVSAFEVPSEGMGKIQVFEEDIPMNSVFTTYKNRVFGPSVIDIGFQFNYRIVTAQTTDAKTKIEIFLPRKFRREITSGLWENIIGKVSNVKKITFEKEELKIRKNYIVLKCKLKEGENVLNFSLIDGKNKKLITNIKFTI
jgi:hypothetical protein